MKKKCEICEKEKEENEMITVECGEICISCFEKIQKHCIEENILTPAGVYLDACEALKTAKEAIMSTLPFTEPMVYENSIFPVVFSAVFDELRRIREEMKSEEENDD
jgi:hypothetical protein